jgi:Domain of unknown function (DUF4070)
VPLLMSRDELRDGYVRVLNALYQPDAYFDRTEALFLDPSFEIGIKKLCCWYRAPRWAQLEILFFFQAVGLFIRLMTRVADRSLRREYRQRLWRLLKVHRRPGLVLFYLFHMAMHLHANQLAKRVARREAMLINSY